MSVIWIFGTIAAIWGAIAGSFLENPPTPYTAVAFGLLAIVFALAAYRGLSTKS